MTKRFSPFLTLVLALTMSLSFLPSANAQDTEAILGAWEGNLKIPNGQLRIVLNLKMEDGKLTSTVDSPDQGANGIPVASTTFEDGKLTMELTGIAARYDGTLNQDGQSMTGTWSQGGASMPLNVEKTDSPTEVNRPQEPEEPYPYDEEDVRFENEADKVTLAGTLTLPRSAGPHPAVVLISGSGPQNRDEELMGHKPFLVLADHLTRQGIAVLRYDDRGTAESTGDFAAATSEDLARDVQAAVDFLKTRTDIAKGKIGLAGHSEGGLIAPMLAVKKNNVDFIVMLAGPGVPGDEILRSQGALMAKAGGMSEPMIEKMTKINSKLYKTAKESSDKEVKDNLKAAITEIKAEESEATLTALGLTEQMEAGIVQQLSGPWFRYFLNHDPKPVLEKVKIPVLSVIGEKDLQVPAEANTAAIKDALAKNKKADIRILPGLNHLFQTANTGAMTEYGQIEETFSPDALVIISDWILKNTGP